MSFLAFIFGLIGFMFALLSYSRIDKLENRLKELGILEQEFKSEDEV